MSIAGLAVSVGAVIIGAINHKRIRSTCCGKKLDVSVDIESTSPVTDRKVQKIEAPSTPTAGG
jgi:hypothetical protein